MRRYRSQAIANRKPRYCPECGGVVVKWGRNIQNKQVWKCGKCGYRMVHPKLNK